MISPVIFCVKYAEEQSAILPEFSPSDYVDDSVEKGRREEGKQKEEKKIEIRRGSLGLVWSYCRPM